MQLELAVGAAATQMQAYVERMDAPALISLLQRYVWLSGRLTAKAGQGAVADAAEQISPADWSEAETGVARATVSGLLGMLLLEATPRVRLRRTPAPAPSQARCRSGSARVGMRTTATTSLRRDWPLCSAC